MPLFHSWLTNCGIVTPYSDIDQVNIGSGNGWVPDGTEPLPKPMVTYRQYGPMNVISPERPQPLITRINLKIT